MAMLQSSAEHVPGLIEIKERRNFFRANAAPAPSAMSLAAAMSRCIGAMPQLVQATMRSFARIRHVADDLRDLLRRFDRVRWHIDDADHTSLTVEQHSNFSGTREIDRLDGHLLDAALGQRRENLFILLPLVAERILPVDIGP